MITFRPVADHAILVDFADTLSDAAHAAVLHLDQALAAHPCTGFREAIPAFVNLLVDFDPLITDHRAVETHLRGLLDHPAAAASLPAQREVLVCYDDDLAPDLASVARMTGLSTETVINAHLAGDYAVFLYGFAPGYAYLGGVPKPIQLDRKPAAVRGVAAGSVIIAGPQCLVTTLTMPTGWWIIGRSPTQILTGDPERPFLFDVGDKVRFRRITRAEFASGGGA
jgi:inhibitor of KinA